MRSNKVWLIATPLFAFAAGWWIAHRGSPDQINLRASAAKVIAAACPLMIEPAHGYATVFEEQSAIRYVFSIRNSSTMPIKIDSIRPTCSCTVVNIEGDVVPAQGSIQFTAVYNVLGQLGELPKRLIQIITNHADCKQLSCEIGGFRQQRFTIEPQRVDFGILQQGNAPTKRVTISAHGRDMHLIPEMLVGTNSKLQASVISHTHDELGRESIELSVGISGSAQIGELDARLFIPRKENDGVGPSVYVHANIVGPVQLMPPIVFFGNINNEDLRSCTAKLVATSKDENDSIRVLRFEDLPNGVTGAVSIEYPDTIRMTLNPVECMVSGDFEDVATIVCELNGKEYALSVPIRGRVANNRRVKTDD